MMKIFLIAFAFSLVLPALAPAGQQLAAEELTIAAVGDLMLGGRAEPFLNRYGPDYPFRKVMGILRRADIVAGNLESPISVRGTAVENKKFTLRAGPIAAAALKSAGIRVVSLANNHAMDFGPLALRDTLTALVENNILFTGAGMDLADARTPAIVKIKGKRLAFLSYSLTFPLEFYASPNQPGTAPGYAEFVKKDIEKIRSGADLVIVSFHWGAELMTHAKDYQIELGRRAVDWGADLVLGHHPHVLQNIELYKGRLIVYSLGNFVFGSESNRTNWSMILLLTFRDKNLKRVEAVPIDVNNYRVKYQPRVLSGRQARNVLQAVNTVSARFSTALDIDGSRGSLALPQPAYSLKSGETASRPSTTATASNRPPADHR
jgi:poly-gamma-glutamate capsule biosynthesis protein CapA/YwtB (metallophosphatase superfamily)